MEFIDLHSIFKDNQVISSIPIFLITQKLQSFAINITSQLGLLYLTLIKILLIWIYIPIIPTPEIVKILIILYPPVGHVFTGNLNVIPDARVRNIISKGPKYRFPSNIEIPKCHREILLL